MNDSEQWNEESLVENRMIEQLQALGYTYIHGKHLQEERTSQAEVVFAESIYRCN